MFYDQIFCSRVLHFQKGLSILLSSFWVTNYQQYGMMQLLQFATFHTQLRWPSGIERLSLEL